MPARTEADVQTLLNQRNGQGRVPFWLDVLGRSPPFMVDKTNEFILSGNGTDSNPFEIDIVALTTTKGSYVKYEISNSITAVQRSSDLAQTAYGVYYKFDASLLASNVNVYVYKETGDLAISDTYMYFFKGNTYAARDLAYNSGAVYYADHDTKLPFGSAVLAPDISVPGYYLIEATSFAGNQTGKIIVQVEAVFRGGGGH